MDSNRSTISSILFALAIAGAVTLAASYYLPQANVASKLAAKSMTKPLPKVRWEAAAPGRVEPNGGEIRMGSVIPGRIVEVTVKPNDRVSAGDLLVRLSDDEALARLHAARAEAAVRKRERDTAEANPAELVKTRRQAQDATMEAVLEWGYRIAATPYLDVQPDFQYVIRPGGSGVIADALVIGVQFAVDF